jgi:hypothetical protein
MFLPAASAGPSVTATPLAPLPTTVATKSAVTALPPPRLPRQRHQPPRPHVCAIERGVHVPDTSASPVGWGSPASNLMDGTATRHLT